MILVLSEMRPFSTFLMFPKNPFRESLKTFCPFNALHFLDFDSKILEIRFRLNSGVVCVVIL